MNHFYYYYNCYSQREVMRMKRVLMVLMNCHNVFALSTSIELDGGNNEPQIVEKEPVKTGDMSNKTMKELGLLLTGSLVLSIAGFSMKEERYEEE